MERFSHETHHVARSVQPLHSEAVQRVVETGIEDRSEILAACTSPFAERINALSPEKRVLFVSEVFRAGWLEPDLDIDAERDDEEVDTLMHAVNAYLAIGDPAYRRPLSNQLAKQLQA